VQKRRIIFGLVAGASVFFIALLLLVQLLGAPLWALVSSQNGWWIVSVWPENPKPGENVTVMVAAGNFMLLPMSNATVTVIEDGKQPFSVYTDEQGRAFFIYSGGLTVVRVSESLPNGWFISRYLIVPTTLWIWICWVAISGAAAASLIIGFAVYVLQKKRGINTDNQTATTKEDHAFLGSWY
jgi:hypothetical protein